MPDDLRPLQPDAGNPAPAVGLRCDDCGLWSCICDDYAPLLDEEYGPSYLVESYDVWDLVGGTAW